MIRRLVITLAALACVMAPLQLAALADSAQDAEGPLTIYCGRGKSLVGPLLERFERQTGIETRVRYAGSTDLATLMLEEGRSTPADVFFSQDPGALGAVAARGLLMKLPDAALDEVDAGFRGAKGRWVGTSGRARVIARSTERVSEGEMPESVFELTQPKWKGRVGWAPPNASFQLFVTAMREQYGDDRTKQWLLDMKANGVRDYPKNRPVIQAIADGEVDLGLVNHYYLYGFKKDRGDDFPVANAYPVDDIGGMMSVAGVGVTSTTDNRRAAERFVEFLLSDEAQRYFAYETGEFALAADIPTPGAPDDLLGRIETKVDLGSLSDRRATLELLRETDVLP